MVSRANLGQTSHASADWVDAIEHLIRWIAPRTVGRRRVLQRLADLRHAGRQVDHLLMTLCLLSRELDALYPQGPVINLAKQRVREAVLTLAHPQP